MKVHEGMRAYICNKISGERVIIMTTIHCNVTDCAYSLCYFMLCLSIRHTYSSSAFSFYYQFK